MIDLNIDLSEDQLKIMSKSKFKSYIKEKVQAAAFSDLLSIKEGHSKGSNILYNKFERQSYLISNVLTNDEKCLLFKLRTNMTQVKENFRSMYDNSNCNICEMNIPQTDSHLLECIKMIEVCADLYEDYETEYLDIFEDLDNQVRATKLFMKIFKAKEKLETPNLN